MRRDVQVHVQYVRITDFAFSIAMILQYTHGGTVVTSMRGESMYVDIYSTKQSMRTTI
jgi:hypothetical protein